MAERYKSAGDSKYKSSRSEINKSKGRDTKKIYLCESKTPPLPSSCGNSIEELLKERQSIKDELHTMSKHKDVKKDYNRSPHRRKRQLEPYGSKSNRQEKISGKPSNVISLLKDESPEHAAITHLDSEDEEYIIEQRRKQRKQLLAQLQIDSELKNSGPNVSEDKSEDLNRIKKQTVLETPQNKSRKINEITDMFSEDDFLNGKMDKGAHNNDEKNAIQLIDNWDDNEGYFKINIGETINKYTISHLFGQGVFANVVKAQDSSEGKPDVAIKIIRNNDLMYKTGLKEIAFLKEINKSDPEDKYHCVKLFSHFMHKGHLCLVLECLHMDLRNVLKKYGRNHGIHLKALMSYSRQLLLALRHLKKNGIIHADIKPDNILVNEKKNILKLCDFGSAKKDNNSEPTPYLVSRFYRAPEIILGMPYSFSIDLWSAACTIYEMSTGKILFTGNSNNKMIKYFMDLKGKIPNRLLRKSTFKNQHFNYNNNFLLRKIDEFTGREKLVEISNINITRDLYKELLKSYKNHLPAEEKKIGQLKDLLDKMLMLDAKHRLSINDCLKHVFIQEELQR